MVDESNANDRRWSEAMRRLFDAKHYASERLLAALDLPESAELLDAASGAEPSVTRGQRVKALTAAMYVDPAGTLDLAAHMLVDESLDSSLRAVTATLVGRSSLEGAEEVLMGAIATEDEVVRWEVVGALARVGSGRAVDALEEAEHVEAGSLRNHARLARAVIAYRVGLDVDPLPAVELAPPVSPEEAGELVELSLRGIDRERIAYCLESLEDSTYGLAVSRDQGFWVAAGRAEWALLVNAELANRGVGRMLMERRNVAGLLARHIPETDTFATQYIVLTRPIAEEASEIMVFRTDGELFYAGRASMRDGEMQFSVASAERPGAAPTDVHGSLGPDGVVLRRTVPGARRRGKRQTTDLDFSSF